MSLTGEPRSIDFTNAEDQTQSVGALDIGGLIDRAPVTGVQLGLVALAALAIILDGFDGQLIGFAIPSLIKEWGVTKADFAPVVAIGLLGMAFGSVMAGVVGDRLGRKTALLISVALFGVTTTLIGFCSNLTELAALRFIAGLGIGGCLPTATTIAGEFVSRRHRAMLITVTIACFPAGGIFAGTFSGYVLPAYGWRGLFEIGGLVPVAFAVLMLVLLPESPRFLARFPARHGELARLLAGFGIATKPGVGFIDASDDGRSAATECQDDVGFRALLTPARRRDTIGLWIAFFGCFFAIYSAFSWLPTMMAGEGYSPAVSGGALTAYNVGGVFGALLCARGIGSFGSRGPMLLAGIGGIASALVLKIVPHDQEWLFVAGFGLQGFMVNAVACTLYALSAAIYPTGARATGIAVGLAFSRVGAILSAFVGAAVITAFGAQGYLTSLALALAIVTLGIAVVRNQRT